MDSVVSHSDIAIFWNQTLLRYVQTLLSSGIRHCFKVYWNIHIIELLVSSYTSINEIHDIAMHTHHTFLHSQDKRTEHTNTTMLSASRKAACLLLVSLFQPGCTASTAETSLMLETTSLACTEGGEVRDDEDERGRGQRPR